MTDRVRAANSGSCPAGQAEFHRLGALRGDPGRIGKEKCWCGHKGCHDWWLTGIGKFCQGSGFSEEEADRIIAALNGELA